WFRGKRPGLGTVGEARTHENSRYGSAHEAVENHAKTFEGQHELSLYQIGRLRPHTNAQSSASPQTRRVKVGEGKCSARKDASEASLVIFKRRDAGTLTLIDEPPPTSSAVLFV